MSEDAQRLLRTRLNQFHAGMVFPGAQRIFGFLWRIVVLLVHKGAGIGDDATEPIGPEPPHRQRRRAARTASYDGSAPRVLSQSKFWESGFDLGVTQDRWHHFVMDESGEAIGHRVVFETALAFFAIVAAIFHRNSDERRQFAFW